MTLSLPANRSEIDASGDVDRRIVFDDPGMNGTEAELAKSKRQHTRGRAAGITLAGVRAIAEHDPDIGRLEIRVDVAETHHTDGGVIHVGRENAQHIGAALHRNFQPLRADQLSPVTEVEPLVVLLVAKPSGDHPKEVRRINRFELHE